MQTDANAHRATQWHSDADYLTAIIDTQNDIAAVELDPATLMQMIVSRAQALTGADGAVIEMVEGDMLVYRAACGSLGGHVGFRLAADSSLSGLCAKTGELLSCEDVRCDARANQAACRRLGIVSMVLVPLSHNGAVVGLLKVVSSRPRGFDARCVRGLRLMAGLLASSLSHAAEFMAKRRLLSERADALATLQAVNERLRESEERFRKAFDHAAIGKALVALDGRWLKVNRSLCRIVGYTPEELLTRDFQSITYGPDLDADLGQARRLLAGEIDDYHMVKRYVHRQGHLVWVLLTGSLVRGADGNPLHFIAQVQDITGRKLAEDALRASEEEYRATFELAGVGKLQTDLTTGRMVRVNRKLCEILGYSADELACMTFAQITHPEDVAANLEAARRMRAGEASEYNTEKRYIRKDGRTVWVNLNAAVIRDADGRAMRAVCTIQDVTDRKRAQWLEVDRSRTLEMVAKDMPLADVLGQLAGALERQVEGAAAALMVLQDGTVLLEGPSLAADWREALAARCLTLAAGLALNLPDDSLGGCGVTFLGDHAVWTELRATARTHGLQTCWSVRFCSSDGTPLGLLSLFHSELRQPTLVELQALDMAAKLASICVEHHNSTRQLAHFVRHDPLTGLPNRMCFEDHLGKAMALARRSGKSVAVIVLDVDCFKEVNDSLGHDAGDALLQELAFRLRATLRESDTVARMGGDEFMMVLPDLPGPEGAALVANELLNCLKRPFLVGGQERVVTSSMGIAIYPRDGEDSATLQRRADEQMYVTKRRGRNGYSIR